MRGCVGGPAGGRMGGRAGGREGREGGAREGAAGRGERRRERESEGGNESVRMRGVGDRGSVDPPPLLLDTRTCEQPLGRSQTRRVSRAVQSRWKFGSRVSAEEGEASAGGRITSESMRTPKCDARLQWRAACVRWLGPSSLAGEMGRNGVVRWLGGILSECLASHVSREEGAPRRGPTEEHLPRPRPRRSDTRRDDPIRDDTRRAILYMCDETGIFAFCFFARCRNRLYLLSQERSA